MFDCIGLILCPMRRQPATCPPPKGSLLSCRPGGTIILEGFSKAQSGKSSRGPQDISMLFSENEKRFQAGEP
ncbi:MAG: hypothetical protein R3C61_15020 [Bacteroidia bacterium]